MNRSESLHHLNPLSTFRRRSFETACRCPESGQMLVYVTEMLIGPKADWHHLPESHDPSWRLAHPHEIEHSDPSQVVALRVSGPGNAVAANGHANGSAHVNGHGAI